MFGNQRMFTDCSIFGTQIVFGTQINRRKSAGFGGNPSTFGLPFVTLSSKQEGQLQALHRYPWIPALVIRLRRLYKMVVVSVDLFSFRGERIPFSPAQISIHKKLCQMVRKFYFVGFAAIAIPAHNIVQARTQHTTDFPRCSTFLAGWRLAGSDSAVLSSVWFWAFPSCATPGTGLTLTETLRLAGGSSVIRVPHSARSTENVFSAPALSSLRHPSVWRWGFSRAAYQRTRYRLAHVLDRSRLSYCRSVVYPSSSLCMLAVEVVRRGCFGGFA